MRSFSADCVIEPLPAAEGGHRPEFSGIDEDMGVAPIGVFGVDVALGVCGVFASMLGTLLIECRRELERDSAVLREVFLLGMAMPGKPSSLFSVLAVGVCEGSTDMTDLTGNTRSVTDGLMNGESEGGEKVVLFGGSWVDMPTLDRGGLS